VAGAADALAAASRLAERRRIRVVQLGGDVSGEARRVARQHAELADVEARGSRPLVIVSGGETTVSVTRDGRGGRNAEYGLALALALAGRPRVHAIACDTDGVDGTEDNAGCIVRPDTLRRARALNLDAADHLARNDAYSFFCRLGDLGLTGPTRTNVNDFRAILVR